MSPDAVLEILREIAMADSLTYWLVGALAVVAFAVMRAMLPVKGLSIVFAPVLFWGGLTAVYAARNAGMVVSTERSVQIVVFATFGMLVSLVVMMALVRLVDAATRIRRPLGGSTGRTRP